MIRRVDLFPRTLQQKDSNGCIFTSVVGVIEYHRGYREVKSSLPVSESILMRVFGESSKGEKISFPSVKKYVLDHLPDFSSVIHDKPAIDDWKKCVVECVSSNIPPIIMYVTSPRTSHAGTVVAFVETDTTWFQIHDPKEGEFVMKSLHELSTKKENEILVIQPK